MNATWLVVAVVSVAACEGPPPRVPPPPLLELCTRVGEADPQHDVPKLRAMFVAGGRDLIVSNGIVYAIPCSKFELKSVSEASGTKGASEDSKVVVHSEGSAIRVAGEQSHLAAADEHSHIAAADEHSHIATAEERSRLAAADEQSHRRDASTIVSCQRLGLGAYRLVAAVGTANLVVFDGATFTPVGPDGMIR